MIDDPDIAHDERVSENLHAAAERALPPVAHIYGFTDERGVRGVGVAMHEGRRVIEVARGIIAHTTERETTELVRFQRTWPLDGYGQEWAVTQVDAVTRTTLDGGETWLEMWHCFTTTSEPWKLADVADSVLRDAVAEDIARDRAMEHNSECDPWPCTNDDCPCECHV